MKPDLQPRSSNRSPQSLGSRFIQFFTSRFSLRSDALWRVMGLVRPMKIRVIFANIVLIFVSMLSSVTIVAMKPMLDYSINPTDSTKSPAKVDESPVAEQAKPAKAPEALPQAAAVAAAGGEAGNPNSAAGRKLSRTAEARMEEEVKDEKAAKLFLYGYDGVTSATQPMIRNQTAEHDALVAFAEAHKASSHSVMHKISHWYLLRKAEFLAWVSLTSRSSFILVYSLSLVALLIFQALLSFLGNWIMNNVGIDVMSSLLRRVYGNVLGQEMQFFDQTSTGSLLNICYREVFNIRDMITFLTSTRLLLPIRMLFLFVSLVFLSPRFTVMLVCMLPVVILPTLLITRKLKATLRGEVTSEMGPMDLMTEVFTGIRAVKTFGAEQQERDFMDPAIDDYIEMSRKRRTAQAMIEPAVDVLNMLVLVFVFAMACTLSGGLQAGQQNTLMAFMIGTTSFYKPFRSLMTMNIQLQRSRMMAGRIFGLLDRQTRIYEAPDPVPFPDPWNRLSFNNVQLDYTVVSRTRTRTREALRCVNLHVNRGEAVALIGPNGAGKSSIVNLLCRLYEPTGGEILIDDTPMSQIRLRDVREKICLITQYPILFNRSVRENIAFGMEGVSDEQIREAARAVRAEAFIDNLPEGMDTPIGEQGKLLSGGERQKLVLARAFVRNPEIVIFDEPTTGLDVQTTAEFLELMSGMRAAGVTIIYITHEPSQLSRMDRVYMLTPEKTVVENSRTLDATHA